MKKRIMAPAFAAILAAGAAGVALTPAGAAAQEGTPLFLVPGAGGQPGQEYVLILTPRTPTAGQYGRGFGQEARTDLDRWGRELYERGFEQGRRYGAGLGYQAPAMGGQDLERFGREQFERGYLLGRLEGQAFQGGGQGMVNLPPRFQEPGVTIFDRPGEFDVFRLPPPGQVDLRQVRLALRDAQQALRQGEAQRAEQALAWIDQTLTQRMPDQAERQRLRQALEDAERALQRDDQQAAAEAIRQARQAVEGQGQAQVTPSAEQGQGQQGVRQQPTAAQAQPEQQQEQQQQQRGQQ